MSRPGRVVQAESADPSLFRPLPYRVYLPPCYAERPSDRYPTVYLLHGLASTDSQWAELGINETADALIRSEEIPPLLIIMPWERTGLDYLTAIPEVLVPAIDAEYRTQATRAARAIGGLSRGAGWAYRIGLRYPETFGAIGLHSPAVLSPDLFSSPRWIAALPAGQAPRIWLDIGDRDPLLESALELRDLLLEQAYPDLVWAVDPGNHDPAYWSDHLAAYLRWYSAGWEPAVSSEP